MLVKIIEHLREKRCNAAKRSARMCS